MPAHTFFLAVAAIIACTAAVAAADSTCVSNWPEARLAGLCNLELGGNVALSPGCTIYRLCTAANPGVRPFPKVCNVTKIFSSLCLDVPDAIPECASARSLVQAAGGNFSACLTASAFAVYNTSAVIGDIIYMCKAMGPAASSMAGCDLCPSVDRCQDPFNTLSIACLNMTMSKCTGWKAFCQTDAAIGTMVGVAAQTFCLKPAARTTPAPPSPPLGNSTCLVDPKKPACSKYKYEAGAADVEALCGFSSQLPACSIWSACRAGQLPRTACDPMTLLVPLCGAASGSPQAASCRGYSVLCGTAGSKVKQCVKAKALRKLPKMSSVVTSLNATCWSPSASTVVPSFATTCANCTAEATCLDPLSTMSKVCIESKNSVSCKDFKAWCTAARAAAKRSYDMLCHY